MTDDELMTIGRFAQLSGLSIHALRHGIPMPQVVNTGCVPVQIKLTVADANKAVEFYRAAFGMEYQVTRRTDDAEYYGFVFGEYGQPGFFLIHLLDDPADFDRLGPSTFSLLVDDLDAAHRRAIAAGAVEAMPPRQPQGMPRSSAVKDPDGNIVWLAQG